MTSYIAQMQENWCAWSVVGVAGLSLMLVLRLLRKNHQRFKAGLPPALYAQLPLSVAVKGALALTIVDIIGTNGSDKHKIATRVFGWLICVALPSLFTAAVKVTKNTLSVLRQISHEMILPACASEHD